MSDLAVGEKEGLDDRIRRIVDEQMNDPTAYNKNFKAWIPKWIETQGVQLPISQVTGAYLTATDTVNLGGDVHGRIGMIRGGAAPYDFTQVTFDSVYGKWVSNSFMVVQGQGGTTYTGTAFSDVTNADGWLVWRSFDVSSMKPQFRLIALLGNNTGGGTCTSTVGFESVDANSSYTGVRNDASWTITSTGTTTTAKDTGWQDVPALTLRDFMFFCVRIKSSSGANTAIVSLPTVLMRWVSK